MQIPNNLHHITALIDSVMDEYEADNKIIFQNESEKARIQFGSINRGLKNWGKSKQCMVPGCNLRSIARSHTVPKGMSLSVIGEDSHVLEPRFNHKRGDVHLVKAGISDATTFPGFCETHELLFSEFENKRSIDSDADFYLQTYRTACRELYRSKFVVEQHDFAVKEYCAARDHGLLRILRERAETAGVAVASELTSLSIGDDSLVAAVEEKIEPVRELAAHVELLRLALEKAVFRADETGVCSYAFKLDIEIPVALAGAASFFVNDNGMETRVFLLISVVPCKGSTILIIGSLPHQKRHVDTYLARWTRHALSMLSMMESWMINGTDQWCIKPSIWHAIPSERQTALLASLMSTKMNIGDDCGISIFDQIRKDLIAMSDSANTQNMTAAYTQFIASERRKMT